MPIDDLIGTTISTPTSTPTPVRGQGAPFTGLGSFDKHQLEALLHDGYRLTPATLAYRITNGQWIPAKHLLYLSTVVSSAIIKGGQFIIVTMPPRHGKSEFLSVHTSTWFLERFPHLNVMLASYGADLANGFAYKVRDTFQNEDLWPLLSTRLRKDKQRVDDFQTIAGGHMYSGGIGGAQTGRGTHLFLIDDYVKNAEEALSPTVKEKIWNWFLSTAFTRLEPNGTIIVLATRWDRSDLIGMIVEKFEELQALGFDPPKIINLPAEARPGDPLGRRVGEPLWPERYSARDLQRIKVTLGSYWWEAMYQQDPPLSMTGLNLGDKLRIIPRNELPHEAFRQKRVRSWDLAATDGGGDFTAGPLMSRDSQTGRVYIEDLVHDQWSPKKVELAVGAAAEADGPGTLVWIEQEPGSAGVNLIQHYVTEVLNGYAAKGEKSTGPIEVRAQPFLAAVEAGLVYAVKADWNQKLKDELDAFPNGDHDDIVSAAALGYNKLCRGRFGGIIWGRDRGARASTIYGGPIKKKAGGLIW